MIKTPLSTVIGGAFWTPGATILGSSSKNLTQLIKSIFASNKQGFAYDPNDLTTMWQDQAKLLPVTGEGQPIWHILDKSGNNNHAFATSSATRPILRKNAVTGAYYLEFDGSDDFLQTNNIDFTATDKVSLFAGVRKLSDADRAIIIELSSLGAGYNGTFSLEAPRLIAPAAAYSFDVKGTVVSIANAIFSSFQAPNSAVITAKASISDSMNSLKVNNTTFLVSTILGTGNFTNYPLYIGRRSGTSLPFNGHIYGLIGIGKLVSDAETAVIEKELAKRVGVTLNV